MPSGDAAHSRKSKLTVASGGADPAAATARHHHHHHHPSQHSSGSNNAVNRPMQYLARLTDFRQMDIQSALDQMKTLLTSRPHVVYKTSYYRKQTKNHWARDDPAFVALQGIFLIIACIAYAVAFKATITGGISFLLYSVLWNWLGAGFLIATIGREIANRHLTVHSSSSHVKQSVEWLYAFDIHCNAFFPLFVVLYAVQFFMLPVVLGSHFMAMVLGNTMYAAALSWYWYVTHLGYRTLPFLSNTEVFLFPIAAIVVVYVLNLILHPFGFSWNTSILMARFYFGSYLM
ncbi:unc-50 homolog [Seminavis robusta]|uniref:Unc-50 homolog n=1 Tax=Seminavis robusta TaxID=568900 RepID=A0A9N8F297_9STRA|nr:unc-50 homolog [Seminavis robusta]CAB9530229.1 unc-50 homolog [Seminavis robusta]|eukprot:Sro1229_g254500.1 unc-50 homolog (289) ;mRNA; f:32323-33281